LFADGSAISATRLLVARASDPQARCFDRATAQFTPNEECGSLRNEASERLEYSRRLVRRDLLATGAGLSDPARQPGGP
jgi:hypothetical protein